MWTIPERMAWEALGSGPPVLGHSEHRLEVRWPRVHPELLSACPLQVGAASLQLLTQAQRHPALYPVGNIQQARHCGPWPL